MSFQPLGSGVEIRNLGSV